MRIRTTIIGGAILSIIAGFLLSQTLFANSPAPGSSQDPVVSKSYVDKAMQDRLKELETQVAELNVQTQALQITINELQTKINKATPGKTTTTPGTTTPGTTTPGTTGPGTTTPGTTTPGTTTPGTDNSLVGKTAYVKGDGNVNLRQAPSTGDTPILGKITKSDPLKILQVKNDWYQVSLSNGTIGWVAGYLVEVK